MVITLSLHTHTTYHTQLIQHLTITVEQYWTHTTYHTQYIQRFTTMMKQYLHTHHISYPVNSVFYYHGETMPAHKPHTIPTISLSWWMLAHTTAISCLFTISKFWLGSAHDNITRLGLFTISGFQPNCTLHTQHSNTAFSPDQNYNLLLIQTL